jgi:adenylate cyclase
VKVRQRRKELFGEYLTSLGIASAIAIAFVTFIFKGTPIEERINKPLFALGSALLYGTAFFLLGSLRRLIRIRNFALNVVIQTGLMALVILVCYVAIVWIIVPLQTRDPYLSSETFRNVIGVVFSRGSIILEVVGLIGAAAINFTFEISKKLGPGVLFNWITGKYYTPREEELVFMFLDMKDSTTLAEKLGAIKFSALVRDFFSDMTVPLTESKGRVSHYIGDEAVIYWKPQDAIKPKGCVAFFKWFQETIKDRSTYYESTYGLVPEFKAGMHIGPVVATEVGEVKSEIVFHGDVLNTTARIQSMCNELGHSLLASSKLASKLVLPKDAKTTTLGAVHLKGKAEELELVSIG